MRWPRASAATVLALHFACAAPLAALAVWFGIVDTKGFGEDRCSSCGVEGYVTAAHVLAALWLGVVVAAASATKRRLVEGVSAVGRRSAIGLAVCAALLVAALLRESLFDVPFFVALLAGLVTLPAAALYFTFAGAAWALRPPPTPEALCDRHRQTLAAAWLGLAVVLPGLYAWVWSDRVAWFVF